MLFKSFASTVLLLTLVAVTAVSGADASKLAKAFLYKKGMYGNP